VRPALARLKTSLFDLLTSRGLVGGQRILDLFAGSGSLGIEALSRGALSVVFVERDRVAARVLRANLAAARVESEAEIIVDAVPRALSRLIRGRGTFDGVFVDPPYGTEWAARTLRHLGRSRLLRDDGWVVVHHRRGERPAEVYGRLCVAIRRRVGDAEIAIYRLSSAEAHES
jgi:16S rRNA (guanine(966)-N(2))-methyltransferase RsmD